MSVSSFGDACHVGRTCEKCAVSFFFFAPARAFPINYCQTCRNGSKLINLWQEFEGAVSF